MVELIREIDSVINNVVWGVPMLVLMIGVGLAKNLAEAVEACRQKGVLVLTTHDRMRLLPPLNIPFPVLREGIERIKEVIGE